METISEALEIESAIIEDWTHRKTEKDGLKMHFNISAPLPRELAKQLKCSGIYDMDTGRIDLLHKLKETELCLTIAEGNAADGQPEGSCHSFFPDVIYKFKASRDENQFTIQFAVHVSNRCEELHEILKHAPDSIEVSIRPRQGQLFEGGTRVDVTPVVELINRVVAGAKPGDDALAQEILEGVGEPDTGCIACNNGIPLIDGASKQHASGTACTRDASAPLASVVTMGGSHQKRKSRADRGTVN